MVKNTLLGINGEFSDNDLDELRTLLKDDEVTVEEYKTAGIEPKEIVRLIFEGSPQIQFVSNYVLGKIVDKLCGKVVSWVRRKKPNAELQVGVRLFVNDEKGQRFSLSIGLPVDKLVEVKTTLNVELSLQELSKLKNKDILSIGIDRDTGEIRKIIQIRNS